MQSNVGIVQIHRRSWPGGSEEVDGEAQNMKNASRNNLDLKEGFHSSSSMRKYSRFIGGRDVLVVIKEASGQLRCTLYVACYR